MEFELLPKVATKTMLKILQIIEEEGKANWTKLANKTGLSQSTINTKLNLLKELKLVDSKGDINSKSGRPIKPYHLTPRGKAVLKKLEELETLLQEISQEDKVEEVELTPEQEKIVEELLSGKKEWHEVKYIGREKW